MLIIESIFEIKDLPFIQDVKSKGGKIYSVGGAIRDAFLNKQSKDLDILITNIEVQDLMDILRKYGKVDLVGMSFGIIKFKPHGETEDIDIAIPRTERKTGDGHKDFEVNADPYLPIEDDLGRRDITINAIAKDIDGNIIDPYNGLEDLKNKIIRVVNPVAFADDPLRMLRCVQFAARFNFEIEPVTMKLIQDNAKDIRNITPERILIELEKITSKGSPKIGAELLIHTGLYEGIFDFTFKGELYSFSHIKTLGKFIHELLLGNHVSASDLFKNKLKGDVDTTKEILAYEKLYKGLTDSSEPLARKVTLFNALNTSPRILQFGQVNDEYADYLKDFQSGKYPTSRTELAIDGNDVMKLGYKGTDIGDVLSNVITWVLDDQLKNDKNEIINYIAKEKMKRLY